MDVASEPSNLQEALEKLPWLVHSIMKTCGRKSTIRDFRLVCKTTSVVGLQVVRGYCLKVHPPPSETDPLPGVAALLQHIQLKRLSIDLILAKGVRSSPAAYQHSVYIAQLQHFISIMGAALSSVKSMKIILHLPKPDESNVPDKNLCATPSKSARRRHNRRCREASKRNPVLEVLSTEAVCEILSLLASACPNVSELSAVGGLEETTLRSIGVGWSKITDLDITKAEITFARPGGPWELDENDQIVWPKQQRQEVYVFPRLTHLSCTSTISGSVKVILHLFACATLVSLHVQAEDFRFDHNAEDLWAMIPPQLRELECYRLPHTMTRNSYNSRPFTYRFPGLEQVILSSYHNLDVWSLAVLLESSPSLKSLSSSSKYTKQAVCVNIDDSSVMLLEEIHSVHDRMLEGFALSNVTLDYTQGHQGGGFDAQIPIEVLFQRMPHSSTFTSLIVHTRQEESGLISLASINLAFPHLLSLELQLNRVSSPEFQQTEVFECLRSLRLGTLTVTPDSLVRVVSCMPALIKIELDLHYVDPGWKHFQNVMRLQAGDWNMDTGHGEPVDETVESGFDSTCAGGFRDYEACHTVWHRTVAQHVHL